MDIQRHPLAGARQLPAGRVDDDLHRPLEAAGRPPAADAILVTHDHYDHLSADDIELIAGPQTVIIGPQAVARS